MTSVALKFQVGARTLASVKRRLIRVGLSLDEVLAELRDLDAAATAEGR